MKQSWFEWACVLFLAVTAAQWGIATAGDLLPPEVAVLDLSPAYGLFVALLAVWLVLGRRRRGRLE
ncbi:MAG TPA: hypothetical protein VGN26_04585 [Armatimonadota bacterium]